MNHSLQRATIKASFTAVIAGAIIALAAPSPAHEGDEHGKKGHGNAGKVATHGSVHVRLVMPKMDPVNGMRLFASKGCVVCHSINGVGGDDAPALDAHTMKPVMSPFDFAAKMWRGAPAMIAAQEEELKGQILFTGKELADIIAFVHDDAQQHKFTQAMIPPRIRKLMHHEHGEHSGHHGERGHHGKGSMHK